MDIETDEFWDFANGVPDTQNTINTAEKYMQIYNNLLNW